MLTLWVVLQVKCAEATPNSLIVLMVTVLVFMVVQIVTGIGQMDVSLTREQMSTIAVSVEKSVAVVNPVCRGFVRWVLHLPLDHVLAWYVIIILTAVLANAIAFLGTRVVIISLQTDARHRYLQIRTTAGHAAINVHPALVACLVGVRKKVLEFFRQRQSAQMLDADLIRIV